MQAANFLIILPLIIFSVIIHEISHGYAALALGDKTAKNLGRLSLNPFKHIDPFGTVLLPVLLVFTTGLAFGYAKPVPIEPRYFKHAERGMMITGAAGPLSNIIIGTFFGLMAKSGLVVGITAKEVILTIVIINFFLALLNLIPIPPLDGSRILVYFLPAKMKYKYYELEKFGLIFMFLLLFLARGKLFTIFYSILVPVLKFFGF